LTLDGGDTWQGSGTSLWTRGADMVEACNLLGVDVMVGHWEFTYKEKEVLKNVGFFKGDFLGQNVRILEDALLGDKYISMTEKYDGRGNRFWHTVMRMSTKNSINTDHARCHLNIHIHPIMRNYNHRIWLLIFTNISH
jgi:hypothetical protein